MRDIESEKKGKNGASVTFGTKKIQNKQKDDPDKKIKLQKEYKESTRKIAELAKKGNLEKKEKGNVAASDNDFDKKNKLDKQIGSIQKEYKEKYGEELKIDEKIKKTLKEENIKENEIYQNHLEKVNRLNELEEDLKKNKEVIEGLNYFLTSGKIDIEQYNREMENASLKNSEISKEIAQLDPINLRKQEEKIREQKHFKEVSNGAGYDKKINESLGIKSPNNIDIKKDIENEIASDNAQKSVNEIKETNAEIINNNSETIEDIKEGNPEINKQIQTTEDLANISKSISYLNQNKEIAEELNNPVEVSADKVDNITDETDNKIKDITDIEKKEKYDNKKSLTSPKHDDFVEELANTAVPHDEVVKKLAEQEDTPKQEKAHQELNLSR